MGLGGGVEDGGGGGGGGGRGGGVEKVRVEFVVVEDEVLLLVWGGVGQRERHCWGGDLWLLLRHVKMKMKMK